MQIILAHALLAENHAQAAGGSMLGDMTGTHTSLECEQIGNMQGQFLLYLTVKQSLRRCMMAYTTLQFFRQSVWEPQCPSHAMTLCIADTSHALLHDRHEQQQLFHVWAPPLDSSTSWSSFTSSCCSKLTQAQAAAASSHRRCCSHECGQQSARRIPATCRQLRRTKAFCRCRTM